MCSRETGQGNGGQAGKTESPVTGAPHTHAFRVAAGTVPEVSYILCCVCMCACSYMWLWWVLPRRLNHRARAVKAPVRFPLRAWPRCRRQDCRCPAAVNAPPPLPGFKTRKPRALPEGAVVRFFWYVLGAGVARTSSKRSEAHLPLAGRAGATCAVVGGGGAFMTTGGIEPPLWTHESMCLTSGPVQASYPALRVCGTNIHLN